MAKESAVLFLNIRIVTLTFRCCVFICWDKSPININSTLSVCWLLWIVFERRISGVLFICQKEYFFLGYFCYKSLLHQSGEAEISLPFNQTADLRQLFWYAYTSKSLTIKSSSGSCWHTLFGVFNFNDLHLRLKIITRYAFIFPSIKNFIFVVQTLNIHNVNSQPVFKHAQHKYVLGSKAALNTFKVN